MRVLVVDDDRDLREGIADLLVEDGLEVSTAADGEEALRLLEAGDPPDVILLDLMMPGVDGRAFRTRQRADPRLARIPVIAMTASGRAEARLDELEVAGFLRKPFEFEALAAALAEIGPLRALQRTS